MIKFLMENEIPVYDMLRSRNQYAHKLLNIPFSTESKMMVTVREMPKDPELVKVYVKGAPEQILPLCNRFKNSNFED